MTHADRIAQATYGIAHLLPQARRAQATGDAAGVVDASASISYSEDTLCGSSIGRAPVTSRVKAESQRNKANIGAKFQALKSKSLPVRVQIPSTQQQSDGGRVSGPTNSPLENKSASIVSPVASAKSGPLDAMLPTPAYILICAELARLAIALHFGLVFRVWLILYQIARETNHTGFTRAEIEDGLRRYHVKYSTRNLTRWLRSGLADGLFWTYDARTGKYYQRGYASLSETLVKRCIAAGQWVLIETNFPGQRKPMYLNIASDNLLQFESNCYAAWIGSRENLTISRQSQIALWARSDTVLRSWESINPTIHKLKNYAFCDEADYSAIPRNADGAWRADVHRTTLNGRDVLAWQLPNSYSASIRQHPHKGQGRRVFVHLRAVVESLQAAGVCEQGDGLSAVPGGSNPNAKRYFATNKGAQNSHAHHGKQTRFVFKGRWNNAYGYYEYTTTGKPVFDYWQCRRVFRRHQCVSFAKRAKKIVVLQEVDNYPF